MHRPHPDFATGMVCRNPRVVLERFTDHAREVFILAGEEGGNSGQRNIGAEHCGANQSVRKPTLYEQRSVRRRALRLARCSARSQCCWTPAFTFVPMWLEIACVGPPAPTGRIPRDAPHDASGSL